MMLSKLQGQPFKTEFPIEQEDTVVPAAPVDAGRAKIAVITTGSLVPVGNPDRIPSGSASVWKRYDIRRLEAFKKNDKMYEFWEASLKRRGRGKSESWMITTT